jgi:hypothetical protein
MFVISHILVFPFAEFHLDTIKIEDVLKNATDRSGWIDFTGYMNTTMRLDYFDECAFLSPFSICP